MRIKAYIKVFIRSIFSINKIIPKHENKIVLYANLGFRDNVKSLYDYLISNNYNEKYKLICSTDDWKAYRDVNISKVKFVSPIAGLFHYLTSKYVFYCFGQFPIKPSSGQVVVNLWHGMPFKSFGNMVEETSSEDFNYFTYTIATSEHFKSVMKAAFGCRDEQVLLVGQPRCDQLMQPSLFKREKIIVWAPTYRVSSRLRSVDTDCTDYELVPLIKTKEQWEKLDELLGRNKYRLALKLHPMQDVSGEDYAFENIDIYQGYNKKTDVLWELLQKSAALISDYSSTFFDYMLLDKPIGFVVDDLDDFIEKRGFSVENPLDYMRGYKIQSFEDLENYLISVFNEKDGYKEQRRLLNQNLNRYQTDNSTKELLDMVGIKGGRHDS